MGQYERLREERNDKRRSKGDRSSAGQKARWTRFAQAKRQKARAQAYWIAKSYEGRAKLNEYTKKA